MLGLRPVERLAADRLGQAGHHVTMPDLYGGRAATNMNEGYALMNAVDRSAAGGSRRSGSRRRGVHVPWRRPFLHRRIPTGT